MRPWLFILLTSFLLAQCSPPTPLPTSTAIPSNTPTPSATPTNTLTPTPSATVTPSLTPTPGVESMLPVFAAHCSAVFETPEVYEEITLTEFGPPAFFLNQTYDEAGWTLAHFLPRGEALTAEEIESLICIQETRTQTGEYENGSPAFKLDWEIRAVAWLDEDLLGSWSLDGYLPAFTVTRPSGQDPVYGDQPVPGLIELLSTYIPDETLIAEGGKVTAIDISPDGTLLASGNRDFLLKFWDLDSSERIFSPFEHTGHITDLAFSPDGKLLATASEDQILRLWNTDGGGLFYAFEEEDHGGINSGIAFSPDGLTLAAATDTGAVNLWDTQVWGTRLAVFEASVTRLAYSPDSLILVGAAGQTLLLWNLATIVEDRTLLSGHTDEITSLAFSSDCEMTPTENGTQACVLASGGMDDSIILWDPATQKAIHTLRGHQDGITALEFSPDGRWLASGSLDTDIILWNLETMLPAHILSDHHQRVTDLAFTPDGQLLASSSWDGTVLLWDVGALE
jgi:WD40 repeat protein